MVVRRTSLDLNGTPAVEDADCDHHRNEDADTQQDDLKQNTEPCSSHFFHLALDASEAFVFLIPVTGGGARTGVSGGARTVLSGGAGSH